MPPQRKKAKTSSSTFLDPKQSVAQVQHDPTLHPDLAAQSTPVKMVPETLHPDLAALGQVGQPEHFTADTVQVPPPPPSKAKQRKNAKAAATAAAAAAAQLAQQALAQVQAQQAATETPVQEMEGPAVSVDAAAEFLRSIQERESQKNMLNVAQAGQDTSLPASTSAPQDNSIPTAIPTDLTALYPIHQTQISYQGFPTIEQYNDMVNEYLGSLSVKKQAKALLTQQMYDDILAVLLHPTETKVGSAQFRFWAKKMFKLVSTQVAHIVIHENKPVAVKEQLYDVLVQCHGQANHGGRDKTAGQVCTPLSCISS